LGITADEALERVERLRDDGIVRRFGAVLNPPVIGSSTLAAVSAPEDRFDEVAGVINGYQQVNHNYARDHEWNMWFVVTAGSRGKRDAILADIEARTECSVLVLPMLTDYYIDLEFPVVNRDRFARESIEGTDASATRISEDAAADLSALDRKLLLEIQTGFPLSATPYRDIAAAVDADPEAAPDPDAVFRARMDLHLVRDDDRDAPFDLDDLRALVAEGADREACAAALDADEGTVARYRRVVASEAAATRANERFRDAFADLLADVPSTRLADDARKDGLREATEDIETDVSF
jgi:DNA-binding Lrp family transcriptional regulator